MRQLQIQSDYKITSEMFKKIRVPLQVIWKKLGLNKTDFNFEAIDDADYQEVNYILTDGKCFDFQLHFGLPTASNMPVRLWVTVEENNKDIIMKTLASVKACFDNLNIKINIRYYEGRDRVLGTIFN